MTSNLRAKVSERFIGCERKKPLTGLGFRWPRVTNRSSAYRVPSERIEIRGNYLAPKRGSYTESCGLIISVLWTDAGDRRPGTEIEPLIFWDFEQGSTMRLAGMDSHRLEVLPHRDRHCAWPVRVLRCCRSGRSRARLRFPAGPRRHGSTWTYRRHSFSKFPEMRPSSVPALLDEKLIKVLEDAAA